MKRPKTPCLPAFMPRSGARRRGLARAWRRWWRDEQGAVLVEYAFVAPAFIALLVGGLYMALMYLTQEGLETAVEAGARLIITGNAQTLTLGSGTSAYQGMTANDFKTAICNGISGTDVNGAAVTYASALPPFLSCSRLAVNVEVVPAGCTSPAINTPTYTYSGGTLTSTGTGYGSANCAGTTNANNGLAGSQGQLVILQLAYLWPVVSLPLGLNFANQPNGNRLMVATNVFTVENYQCATSSSTC